MTLQPLHCFSLDAAILFSDILTIPDAMRLGLYFLTSEGPVFQRTIGCLADIKKLPISNPEQEMVYVMNALRAIRKALQGKVPLIAFLVIQ